MNERTPHRMSSHASRYYSEEDPIGPVTYRDLVEDGPGRAGWC